MQQSSKKRRIVASDSEDSSTDEGFTTPCTNNSKNNEPRSSERIRIRRNKNFTMPTKQNVLCDIPTTKSPHKSLDRWKPRRLVNNYTKENNRYNYDPASSNDSNESDFIDDDQVSSEDDSESDQSEAGVKSMESEESTQEEETNPFHLVQRHHASKLESDSEMSAEEESKMKHNSVIESDSEESDAANDCQCGETIQKNDETKQKPTLTPDEHANCVSEEQEQPTSVGVPVTGADDGKISNSNSDLSDSELIFPKVIKRSKTKKQKKETKRRIFSSDESDLSDAEMERPSKKRRAAMASEDSSSSEDTEMERLYSSNEDDGCRVPSERAQIMIQRKEGRSSLLEEVKAKRLASATKLKKAPPDE